MNSEVISKKPIDSAIHILLAVFISFFIFSCEKDNTTIKQSCLLLNCEIIRSWNSGSQIDTLILEFEYDDERQISKFISHDIHNGFDYAEDYYFFYQDNGKIKRIDVYDEGYLDMSYVFTWNDNTASMAQWWDTGDSLEPDDRIFEWEFNSQNQLIRLNDIMDVTGDEVPELWMYWKYYYDNGNMIKMDEFGYDSLGRTTTYTYDNNKNPLFEQHLGWFLDFDLFLSKSNILTEEIFNYYQNQVTTTKNFSYQYNEYGYPIEMISSQISPSFTIDETWKFEYNCDSI